MINIDGEFFVYWTPAARLVQLDRRTLRLRAADLGIRTIRLPGRSAELYSLNDLQRVAAARRPEPAPVA